MLFSGLSNILIQLFRQNRNLRLLLFTEIKFKLFISVGTAFNDGKSCYRTCDGRTKTCYYEFHAQYYDTMNR